MKIAIHYLTCVPESTLKARWVLSSWHSSVNLRIPAPSDESSLLVTVMTVAVSEYRYVVKAWFVFQKVMHSKGLHRAQCPRSRAPAHEGNTDTNIGEGGEELHGTCPETHRFSAMDVE